ncbi:hypothetical protein [Christiangramia aestuarii]|uniref:Uncharacterized protein n=1 Tax=Christiangramia aestuarii TaxID=1028746 RepID=A0A7K1LQ75_9FLAO|nr:hypothetical protein [Christiangramia aestuarii]MUP42936.1 hypothetical protein [Christiangramia aestuarii]
MFLIKYSTTMRNLAFIFTVLLFGWSVSASVNSRPATNNYYSYNDSFIFVEGGVEFAVYPNGEFDFYFNPDFRRGNSVHISTPNVNISYNSGYDYDPFIQYDDYGAVIQIESVPIYYDYYGRIVQAGNVFMDYNHFGRLARVGNLRVHYNRHHHIPHYSGYINHYNRQYVYRPWHDYYRRPQVNVSIVFGRPYRAYYEPHRVSYEKHVTVYNNYYVKNKRHRNFYRPSQKVRSYKHGRKTPHRREIAYVKTNSDYNRAATRQSVSRDNVRAGRMHSPQNRKTVDRSRSTKQARVYSDRNKRSTNSRGRSSRIEKPNSKRQVSQRPTGVRTSQKTVGSRTERSKPSSRIERSTSGSRSRTIKPKTDTRIKTSAPSTRTRSIEKSRRNSERNSVSKRPTRQRSSSVRTRSSSSGSSRNQAIKQKNSSRSRSSARNMNNRL